MAEPKFLHEAAMRLRNDPQLAPFKEWLMAERERVRLHLETAGDAFKILQGEAQCLARVLDVIENSPRVLEHKRG